MKKITLLLVLLSFSFGVSAANGLKERATALTNNMETSLALTPDQKAKLYNLNLTKLEALDKLSKAENKEEARKESMVEKRKYITEVRGILTEEQYKKWNVLRNEQSQKIKKGEKVENPVIDEGIDLS